MKTFPLAEPDRFAKFVTIFLVVVLVGISAMLVAALPPALGVPLALVYVAIMAATWAFSPRAYRLEAGELVVERRAGKPFRTPIRGGSDMPDPHRMGFRIMGSGGAFGYFGRFRRKDVKVYRAYMSTRDPVHVIALDTDAGVVTVSPADPGAFKTAMGTR